MVFVGFQRNQTGGSPGGAEQAGEHLFVVRWRLSRAFNSAVRLLLTIIINRGAGIPPPSFSQLFGCIIVREAEVHSCRPSPDVSDHDQVKLDGMTPGWADSTVT